MVYLIGISYSIGVKKKWHPIPQFHSMITDNCCQIYPMKVQKEFTVILSWIQTPMLLWSYKLLMLAVWSCNFLNSFDPWIEGYSI